MGTNFQADSFCLAIIQLETNKFPLLYPSADERIFIAQFFTEVSDLEHPDIYMGKSKFQVLALPGHEVNKLILPRLTTSLYF